MADRATVTAGVWNSIVDQWREGDIEAARSLERFLTALEVLDMRESASEESEDVIRFRGLGDGQLRDAVPSRRSK
jgi:dihydrodipicolinate synthase/N-acetylneuraminate lyase